MKGNPLDGGGGGWGRVRLWFQPVAFLVFCVGFVDGHDPQFTAAAFWIRSESIDVEWTTTVKSLVELTGKPFDGWQQDRCRMEFAPELLKHLILSNEGRPCTGRVVKVETMERLGGLKYTLSFVSPKPLGRLTVFYDIFLDLPDLCEPQDFATFRLGDMHGRHVFTPGARTLELDVGKMLSGARAPGPRDTPGR